MENHSHSHAREPHGVNRAFVAGAHIVLNTLFVLIEFGT